MYYERYVDDDEEESEDIDEEQESDNEDEEEEESSEEEQDEVHQIVRADLAKMSMLDILKLKEKVGKKAFAELMTGKKIDAELSSEDAKLLRKPKQEFKRENKNRPREMSSKRPVKDQPSTSKAEPQHWDPRFEQSSGEFKQEIFSKNYEFLNDVREKEVSELKKRLKKAKTDEERSNLKYLLTRALNQQRAAKQKDEKLAHAKQFKNKVKQETGNRFVNKSHIKKDELVGKFLNLKKSGKLEKYMEKKRKKNAARDRKRLNV